MPKYTSGRGDWVELTGAAKLSMRKLDGLYSVDRDSMFGLAQSLIVASVFQTEDGTVDAKADMLALTLQQWDWLRERIFQAARDEVLAPQP